MSRSSFRMIASTAAMLALGVVMGGCLIRSSSRTFHSGAYISPQTMSQIQPGSGEDFVLATLGPPTTKTDLSDGTSLWRWTWRQTSSSDGRVFLLLNTDSHSERQASAFVQMKDGTVVKSWRD